MSIKCPECQAENPNTKRFCGDCGTKLSSQKDTPGVTITLPTPQPTLEKTISKKYSIIEEIGRGGMGVVYKAGDTKLRRNVALKFLPEELTRDKKAKARFIQEAQAAAALNHPNICVIYEVDDSDDQTFISMEYIEGQTLKDRIESGPLEIDDAKDIILQVAKGLKEAHEQGIVHRDIKPANIMLTPKGQAKIMDFGVAKLSWGVDLTKTSTIIGTVAYMSPEQARGAEVDLRTDIWSLGAMFYEMLTGKRPFQKDHEQSMIYSILNDKPEPISSLRPDVPKSIEAVVNKALEKHAAKRFQDAEEFIGALTRPIVIKSARPEKSIAVLPFTNMSADPEQEYFCDGMAEEIINSLTNIKDLRVVARTSAFSFKGKDVDIREIGKKLNVEKVLEGSVRKSGDRLRITAQLINVEDGYHLWSERFDRDMEDIFDIQDEISLAIADVLKAKLLKEEKAAILKPPTADKNAYNLYLKGRFFFGKLTDEGSNKAIKFFEEAIKRDRNFALAYTGIAESYVFLCWGLGICPPKDSMEKAKKAAEKAVELDPELADAHKALAIIKGWYEWDRHEGEKSFIKAIELNPNSPSIHMWYALHLTYLEHKIEEGLIELKRAQELDPLDLHTKIHLSVQYLWLKDTQKVGAVLQEVLVLDPLNAFDYHMKSDMHTELGELDKAIEAMEKAISLGGPAVNHLAELAQLYALTGKKDQAWEIIRELEERSKKTSSASFFIAVTHMSLGEKDKAFKWLEKAVEEKDIALLWGSLWFSKLEGFKEINEDPRWSRILKKMGLSHLAPQKEIEANSVPEKTQSPKSEKSIVVLPFDDVSPNKDNEYFSDGLTEEIISDLSKIQALRVISRTSAMRLKGTDKSLKSIARELDVRYVLEGSVRKAGNNLRITAQLIETAHDAHLWSEKYSGSLDDIFDIQEKVSRSIVDALEVKLSNREDREISERPIQNIQAFEHYLRAKQEIYKFTEQSLNKATGYLEEALTVEGENDLLYAELAHTYYHFWNFGIRVDEQDLKQADVYVKKTFELNAGSPDGFFARGLLEIAGGDVRTAISYFKKALSAAPNHLNALAWLSHVYALFGKTGALDPLIDKLSKIDPYHDFVWGIPAIQHIYQGQFETAAEKLAVAYQANKENYFAQWWYGLALLYAHDFNEAFSIIQRLSKGRDDQLAKLLTLLMSANQNKKTEVFKLISPELKTWAEKNINYSLLLADCYALLDEKEKALDWIEITVKRGNINFPFLNEYDPFLANVRGEERFKTLMERVKKEWENFED